VRAADVERTRIERDLHDGVQPRLVSVAMTLGLAQQQIDTDPDSAKALIAEAHTSTKAAITELRQLARGIYASVLDDRGLDAALSALAARSHIPVQLDVRLQQRCGRDAEAAVYFAIAESLTNAAKHSRASECRVVVRVREDGMLWARVEDNGIGGARVTPGGGLDGVMNRVLAAGGSTRLDSPQGGPTALEVSVPCAS
jgi:signal transduction histidine kinase